MTARRRLTEPLGTLTLVFGVLMTVTLAAAVVSSIWGSGSIGGFGHAWVCATQPRTGISGSSSHAGFPVRHGAWLNLTAPLQVCTTRPTMGQRVLYTLTTLPTTVVWAGVLLLLWRLIRLAARGGPFTLRVASAMRTLAWFVLTGAVVTAMMQGFATDQLLNTMLVHPGGYGDVFPDPRALIPVPALVSAGLLTFARIVRLGAAMDEEIRATV